jgi:hypothetical protein
MGSVVWSADTIITSYLHPATFAYNSGKFIEAATALSSLNNFFLGFGVGITDLPPPYLSKKNLKSEMERELYSRQWYEKYLPLISKAMGKYLRETIDHIKWERGNT